MIMPGRAVAALEGAGVEERLLERVQLPVASSRPSMVVIALPATAPTRAMQERAGGRRPAPCRPRTGPRRSRTWSR